MKPPKILNSDWGSIQIQNGNKVQQFKDVKLYPGGARAWDWTETGTHHQPGIQPADVQELVKHDAEYILLSKGRMERLQTANETKNWLEEHDISFEILETGKLIRRYNELRDSQKTGALIHTTC